MTQIPLTIAVTDAPTAEMRSAIGKQLDGFNQTQIGGPLDFRPLAIPLSDPDTGEIVGGLLGATIFSYLHVDALFVPASMRRAGWGRKILIEAEAGALRRGCHGVWLSTFTFQARGFYERLGYSAFGTVDHYPPGHSLVFLSKRLGNQPAPGATRS
ncbi:MAG TPA: GNAT family N-acetyltransferase [Xanthobacteraceae bacterium]|nr:GNAT family N-acetyltransferase [Xanthobacteraceae bacterium]